MNKITAFASRNIKEMLRDPLSYIFCLGFPMVMLIIMSIVNESIPPESGMTVFRIDNLAGGVAIFGQTFVMLFAALAVAGDRSGSFLVRMYATPMRSSDFCIGYMLPFLLIAVVQAVITYVVSFIISLITGVSLSPAGLLISVIALIPSALMFIGFGILFGTIFSEKAAPGLCSIIISVGSMLGGIWMDVDNMGGVMLDICKCMPFYYCTKTARSAIALDFGTEKFLIPIIIVTVCAAVLVVISSLVFGGKMKADLS